MLHYLPLRGSEARAYATELATLRLKIFWDFPYLYEGTHEYEMKYLETYFKAQHSFILLVQDGGKTVGATTGIWAQEEEDNFKKPFADFGIKPEEVFYFGESVLLPEYRGKGIGKKFFAEREKFANSLPFIKKLSFCAVERSMDHPLRPGDYEPLDEFWKMMGFHKEPGLITKYEWQDRNETKPTEKKMQFWLKDIRQGE